MWLQANLFCVFLACVVVGCGEGKPHSEGLGEGDDRLVIWWSGRSRLMWTHLHAGHPQLATKINIPREIWISHPTMQSVEIKLGNDRLLWATQYFYERNNGTYNWNFLMSFVTLIMKRLLRASICGFESSVALAATRFHKWSTPVHMFFRSEDVSSDQMWEDTILLMHVIFWSNVGENSESNCSWGSTFS